MSGQEIRFLIKELLFTVAEEVDALPDSPSKGQIDSTIKSLYEIMRQLSEWSENGTT